MTTRPPLTCHVLDTTTGKPAADILCSVYKVNLVEETADDGCETYREAGTPQPFAMARTDSDGRVPQWTFDPSPAMREQLVELGIVRNSSSGQVHWDKIKSGTYRIRFQVGKYYRNLGQENFHPVVDIMFNVMDSKHYHIPLLLSNYGYTTYRGS